MRDRCLAKRILDQPAFRRGQCSAAGEIFSQRSAAVRVAIATAAAQFGNQQIDDVRHYGARRRLGNKQHEAAAAACGLEYLFKMVGHLRSAARHRDVVAGCGAQAMIEKFFARDFNLLAVFFLEQMHKPDWRRIGRDNSLLQFGKREPVGELRHIVTSIVREPNADRLRRYVFDQVLA